VAIPATAVDHLVPSKPLLILTGDHSRLPRIRTTGESVNRRHVTLARLLHNGCWWEIPSPRQGRLVMMLQPEAQVFDETVSFSLDDWLPLILTISDGGPVRFLFVRVQRP
jgi:hypothetical protein